jgi:hypothetical protein
LHRLSSPIFCEHWSIGSGQLAINFELSISSGLSPAAHQTNLPFHPTDFSDVPTIKDPCFISYHRPLMPSTRATVYALLPVLALSFLASIYQVKNLFSLFLAFIYVSFSIFVILRR